jgi:hypothetical protein
LSPGSLGELFRLNGFEVIDMYLEYDDQYLFIEAIPVDVKSTKVHPHEESRDDLKRLTENFSKEVNTIINEWRIKLRSFKSDSKKVVVWGGGSKSVGFLTNLDQEKAIQNVVDINPYMQGNFIPGIGHQYVGPDALRDIKPDVVIVMNSVYIDEIRKMLHERDLDPEIIGL